MDFKKPNRSEEHPTMKPVELFAYQIQNSTKKCDIVLDLFGGSGTTIIACEQTGRIGYSMELDPRYCDVIIKRYENLESKYGRFIENDRYKVLFFLLKNNINKNKDKRLWHADVQKRKEPQ